MSLLQETTARKPLLVYRTAFGIASHVHLTTVFAILTSTGKAEARIFRGNPYDKVMAWMTGFPAFLQGLQGRLRRLRPDQNLSRGAQS